MKNYKEIIENHNILKEFCRKYKIELKILGGIISEKNGLTSYKDYMKFINTLNDDEFTANYFGILLNDSAMNVVKDVVNNVEEFDNYVRQTLTDLIFLNCDEKSYKKYKRELKKVRA